jgi:lipid II:glycine glycyltransferase (peptidoglycan interpeptide bridge formation enzyme)
VFSKPNFSITFQGHSYQVICKEKKIFWIIVVWFQILGVYKEIFGKVEDFQNAVLQEAKKYYYGKKFIPIYTQLGCTDVLLQYPLYSYKQDSESITEEFRKVYSHFISQNVPKSLVLSNKHNLPDATIVVNCTADLDQLRNNISRNTKDKIKKAKKMIDSGELKIYLAATPEDYQLFYTLYSQTAENKWFGAVTGMMWKSLQEFLALSDYGKLFLISDQENNPISGALCLQDGEHLIYLYGANDRRYGNAGISQFLHSYIIEYAHEHAIKRYDFLGASRIGISWDWLEKITQFKSGFGGEKVEHAGSWDLPFSKLVYWLYKNFS